MIVDTDVSDVLRHMLHGVPASSGQQCTVTCELKGQEPTSILESLRPLGPTPCRVAPLHREHRGAVPRIPALLQMLRLFRREFHGAPHRGNQLSCRNRLAELHLVSSRLGVISLSSRQSVARFLSYKLSDGSSL